MSWNEFLDWAAYFGIEPLPGSRADLHAAQVCAVLGEINRNRKKRRKPFKPADFLPDWWGDQKRRTRDAAEPDALLAKLQALTDGWGAVTAGTDAGTDADTETETYGADHRDAQR